MRLVSVLCPDPACDALVSAIRKAAHTGNAGDGIIVVHEDARVVRIRSGEEQNNAV